MEPTPEVGRGGARAPGVERSCRRALDCSVESMLMTISSSSLGTLVLVSDSSPRACGGVEYSFVGFFGWRDFEGFDLLLLAGRLGGLLFPSIAIGLLGNM